LLSHSPNALGKLESPHEKFTTSTPQMSSFKGVNNHHLLTEEKPTTLRAKQKTHFFI
jgi:hypothetical protein